MPINEELLLPESQSLHGLPTVLNQGLTAVSVIAGVSLFSTTALFLHLTFKLAKWHVQAHKASRAQKRLKAHTSSGMDLSLGLTDRHLHGGKDRQVEEGRQQNAGTVRIIKPEPNQFVVLLYNLLLADIHQSMAFFLNTVWVGNDAILIDNTACWAQGWFVSTGDLSASLFVTAIAVHTYCIIVRGWKPPQWALITTCVGLWVFNYALAIIGVAITGDGKNVGGYYVRAAAWCWVNEEFETLRLALHYLYIFISLAVTSILYTLIFLSVRQRSRNGANRGRTSTSGELATTTTNTGAGKRSMDMRSTTTTTTMSGARPTTGGGGVAGALTAPSAATKANLNGHHPAFLIYPVIYVICTLPLALGRIATMAGADVPLSYFCAAGALIVSNGWADVLLWGMTRRSVIFGHIDDDDLGIETFAFMRTPARRFGNMVWVEGQGGQSGKQGGGQQADERSGFWERLMRGPEGWREVGRGGSGRDGRRGSHVHGHRRTGERSISQESLRGNAQRNDLGMAIQMDLVTTVVVEVDHDAKGMGGRTREPSAHSTASDDYGQMGK